MGSYGQRLFTFPSFVHINKYSLINKQVSKDSNVFMLVSFHKCFKMLNDFKCPCFQHNNNIPFTSVVFGMRAVLENSLMERLI